MSEGNATRRQFVKGVGATTAAGFVTGAASAEDGSRRGGRVTIGNLGKIAREQFNPLLNTQSTEKELLEIVYDAGVVIDPRRNEYVPWAFESVDVRPDNVGTDRPAVVATLREGQRFDDGVRLTAADVAYTFEVIFENDLSGTRGVNDLSGVEAVRAPDDRTVEYVFSEPIATFETDVLAVPILPEHRWREYDPLSTDPVDDGLIGSGPFQLESLSIGEGDDRAVVSGRDDYTVGDAYGIPGPFVDELEWLYVEEGIPALDEILRAREADIVVEVVPEVSRAIDRNPCFTLDVSTSDGFEFAPYNLRRRPFDDAPFRRALTTVYDAQVFIERDQLGFGVPGDYAAPPAFDDIRPQQPAEADRYAKPKTADGSFDVTAVRDRLRNADSDREYAFGSVVNDEFVTGDRELRIDGRPLTEFHTDNAGNAGEGPITLLRANERVGASLDRWVSDLRQVGIPVDTEKVSFQELIVAGFVEFDFDFYEISVNDLSPTYSYLSQFFASGGRLNTFGYSGVDDLLDRQATVLDEQRRESLLRDVVGQVYDDSPLLVLGHNSQRQPVFAEYSEIVSGFGGILNKLNFLSLRKSPVVGLDVKPGSPDPAPISGREGTLPVGFLAEDVDPTRIRPESVRFGDAATVDGCGGATPVGDGVAADLDGDGRTDRLFRFRLDETGIDADTESVRLLARLDDDTPVRGSAPVRIVGN